MNQTQKPTCSGTSGVQPPRLVLHADCTTCGRLNGEEDNPLAVVDIALDHTDGTAHVVVLNGTTDIPGEDWIPARDTSAGESGLPPIPEFCLILQAPPG